MLCRLLYIYYVHFLDQPCLGVYRLSFAQQQIFILIAGAVMAQQQLAYPCVTSH